MVSKIIYSGSTLSELCVWQPIFSIGCKSHEVFTINQFLKRKQLALWRRVVPHILQPVIFFLNHVHRRRENSHLFTGADQELGVGIDVRIALMSNYVQLEEHVRVHTHVSYQ